MKFRKYIKEFKVEPIKKIRYFPDFPKKQKEFEKKKSKKKIKEKGKGKFINIYEQKKCPTGFYWDPLKKKCVKMKVITSKVYFNGKEWPIGDIISRPERNVREEYISRVKTPRGSVEVFKNPTKSEFRDALKSSSMKNVRGFYDPKTKDVWIWQGDVLHTLIAKLLQLNKLYMEGYHINVIPLDRELQIYSNVTDPKEMKKIAIKVYRRVVEFFPEVSKYKIYHNIEEMDI